MTLTREEAIALNEANRDIIENEKPFGLMTADQRTRIDAWGYGVEKFFCDAWGLDYVDKFNGSVTYRAKPAPVPAGRVVQWVNAYPDYLGAGRPSLGHAGLRASSDRVALFRIEYNADGTDPKIFVEDGE